MIGKKNYGILLFAVGLALVFTACEQEAKGKTKSPEALPPGGVYSNTQFVTLMSETEGANIYYTVDGSRPNTRSTLYTSAIPINSNTILKAIAVKNDLNNSSLLTEAYTITNFDMVLTELKWLEILENIENNNWPDGSDRHNGTLNLSKYTRPDDIYPSGSGSGLRYDGTFDPGSNISIGKNRIYSIILPDTTTKIADGTSNSPTFQHFRNLRTISGAFLSTIGDYAFANDCTSISITSLPSGLTSIGNNSFQNCTNLSSLDLPYRLISIGDSAFQGCTNLSSIYLPSGLISIGDSAFQDCRNLDGINLPSNIISIGNNAFRNCTSITDITFPSGLTSIGAGAFMNCNDLEVITCEREIPPTLGVGAFADTKVGMYILVPASNITEYKQAWSSYSDVILAINGSRPYIIINIQPESIDVTIGIINHSLSVIADVTMNILPRYQWYSNTSNSNNSGTAIIGATSNTYTISTTLARGTYYYYCEIMAAGANSVRSEVARVGVIAPEITIITHPISQTVAAGNINSSLYVEAEATIPPGETLSYQWYSNTYNSNNYGNAISNETDETYTIPTTLSRGTYYRYCVISADGAQSVRSDVAVITVISVSETLTADTWTSGNISSSGGEQWFKFTAINETQYIHISFGTLVYLNIQLYDSNFEIVGGVEELYSSYNNISRSVTDGEIYYIKITPYGNVSGTYKIAFNASSTAPPGS